MDCCGCFIRTSGARNPGVPALCADWTLLKRQVGCHQQKPPTPAQTQHSRHGLTMLSSPGVETPSGKQACSCLTESRTRLLLFCLTSPKLSFFKAAQRETLCVCVCMRVCVCVYSCVRVCVHVPDREGSSVFASTALAVVSTARCLTSYSACLTGFREPLLPPYRCHTGLP